MTPLPSPPASVKMVTTEGCTAWTMPGMSACPAATGRADSVAEDVGAAAVSDAAVADGGCSAGAPKHPDNPRVAAAPIPRATALNHGRKCGGAVDCFMGGLSAVG